MQRLDDEKKEKSTKQDENIMPASATRAAIKKLSLIHTANGDGSKTAKIIKR